MADSKLYEFRNLKSTLSKLYDGERYFWLRLCLFDLLSVGDVTNPDSIGNDLFNALEDRGLITPTNVNILLEIAKLTEMNDAVNLVKGYINDNRVPNTDEPKLSSFRIQLFKAMRQVHPGALRDLIAYYGLGHYNLKNIWDVVLKLEIDVILEDEPDKIERFANCLGPAVKRILLVTGNTVNNRNRCVSSSNQCEPSEGTDLSEDDFRQLIADFVQWYDERGLLTKLKVLYIYILGDVQALKRVTSTIDLLALLTEPGLLSRTNFSILYDTLKVTNQLGFESPVTKKLPLFKDIKNRDPVTFSPHTIKIFNLGKDLSDSDVKTLDGRYNFPVLKKYEDSWSLILDFEPRGLLSEDKLDEVKGVLKRPRQEKRF